MMMNRVRENGLRFGIGGAREPIREDNRRREAAALARVNRRRNENHVLGFFHQLGALVRRLKPRVHQLALDLAIVLQVRERARVGDEDGEEGTAERRLAEHARGDARAGLVERGEVVGDLFPAREMAIGAGVESEDGGGGGDAALGDGGRGRDREERKRGDATGQQRGPAVSGHEEESRVCVKSVRRDDTHLHVGRLVGGGRCASLMGPACAARGGAPDRGRVIATTWRSARAPASSERISDDSGTAPRWRSRSTQRSSRSPSDLSP